MKANRKMMFRRKLLCAAVVSCFTVMPAFANPTGATVVNGQVSFATQGSTLTITNSPNAIINWQQFSINAGETTRFIQQSSQSAVLNRVVGQDPSQLLGSLLSNGRVYLINPNGILFGQGAVIDVGGLVASTLKLSDADFLAGRLNFTDGAGAGSINNQGSITTPDGGNVYLIAPDITNSGVITSPHGEILLAAGHSVNLMDTTNPDVQVTVGAPDTQVVNIGSLIARSGRVGIYGALIDQQGLVNADTAVIGADGKITLKASKDITLEPGSVTTASGEAGGVKDGGEIRIVADGKLNVRQDSEVHVDGGADGGNGGFLELSGKQNIALNGTYTGAAKAAGYHGGTLLLDPTDIIICSDPASCGSSDIFISTLGSAGVNGSISASASPSTLYLNPNMAGTGGWTSVMLAALHDISVNSALTNTDVPTGGSLTLTAGNDININANIGTSTTDRFSHDLTLHAGNNININKSIYLGSNQLTLWANPAVTGGGGNVVIHPLNSTSVIVDTLGDIVINAVSLTVSGGTAQASGEFPVVHADAKLHAGGNLDITTTNGVTVRGGTATANASSGSSQEASANAELSANGSLTIHAASLTVQGGSDVNAGASGSNGRATATANAKVQGGTVNITTTGGSVIVQGGGSSSGSFVQAHVGSSGHAKVEANAEISATGALTITSDDLKVAGGYAKTYGSCSFASANANAKVHGGTVDITTNVNGVTVQGGSASNEVWGSSLGGTHYAKANAEISAGGGMTLTLTSGDLTLTGGSANASFSGAAVSKTATAQAVALIEGGTAQTGTMLIDVAGNVPITGGTNSVSVASGNQGSALAFAGIVNSGPINMTIGGATGLTFNGGNGGAAYSTWIVPDTGSGITPTYLGGGVQSPDPIPNPNLSTLDAAFIMTRMSVLPTAVQYAVDLSANSVNESPPFYGFVEPFRFGYNEDNKNDKPVCN